MIRDIHGVTRRLLMERASFDDARVLEIGCGAGRVTAMYVDAARRTLGVEPDAAKAREAARAVPGAFFAGASGMDLPLGTARFDVVLFSLSLHHHPDPLAALEEARRVLAPGGRILAIEPTAHGEVQLLCNIFENEDHRLEAAADALKRTTLRTLSDEEYGTDWEFADFDEMEGYIFTYYDHPPDAAKSAALRAFLGARTETAPLGITDRLRLICLAEG